MRRRTNRSITSSSSVRTVPDSKEFRRYSGNRKIETSVDKIFELSEVNGALAKVAGGGSKGKTILKIS